MRWYLNDSSLQGQFPEPIDFVNALSELLKLRARSPILRDRFFCSRMFVRRPVTPTRDCGSAVVGYASREEKAVILAWITKNGPFIDDDRLDEIDDYFEFEGSDVTDEGLGEAARRIGAFQLATVFSFVGGDTDFRRTPLSVQHGLTEQPIRLLEIPNIWDSQTLMAGALQTISEPSSWRQMLEHVGEKYDRLWISEAILEQLNGTTFYPSVSKRVIELLGILQELMGERHGDNAAKMRSREIHQQFFTGEKARFTDESSANKNAFKQEMTFKDPADHRRTIFCPWHGKIQTPQFRIHFEWPVPIGQLRLKVLYVGPKITKA